MPHIYGLDETAIEFASAANGIAADVAAKHAAEVDAQAIFPTASITALAERGFLGLCVAPDFGGKGRGHARLPPWSKNSQTSAPRRR